MNAPPSLNESGVTFKTPHSSVLCGRPRRRSRSGHSASPTVGDGTQNGAANDRASCVLWNGFSELPSITRSPSTARRNLARTRLEDAALTLLTCFIALVGVGRNDHALARRHRVAFHDGVEVRRVEGLALEQRLGDCVELLDVGLTERASARVLLVDDAAHLGVDLLSGLLRVVLMA